MSRNIEQIKKAIIADYKKQVPDEPAHLDAFSLYILGKYANLLYKLYERAEKR